MRAPRPSAHVIRVLGATALTLITVTACGPGGSGSTSSAPAAASPGAAPTGSLEPGTTGDCPLPVADSSVTASSGVATTSVGTATASTGVVGPASSVTAGGETPGPASSAVPGHPELVLPSPTGAAPGDLTAVVGSGPEAVALHVGHRLSLLFPPSQAVTAPVDPDPGIVHAEGHQCRLDGTADFEYTALRPGTVVFVLLPGPRCLHSHPACLPAQREEPLRVDVVP